MLAVSKKAERLIDSYQSPGRSEDAAGSSQSVFPASSLFLLVELQLPQSLNRQSHEYNEWPSP